VVGVLTVPSECGQFLSVELFINGESCGIATRTLPVSIRWRPIVYMRYLRRGWDSARFSVRAMPPLPASALYR